MPLAKYIAGKAEQVMILSQETCLQMQLEWIMATSTIYLCMQKSWAFLCGKTKKYVRDAHAIGGKYA